MRYETGGGPGNTDQARLHLESHLIIGISRSFPGHLIPIQFNKQCMEQTIALNRLHMVAKVSYASRAFPDVEFTMADAILHVEDRWLMGHVACATSGPGPVAPSG